MSLPKCIDETRVPFTYTQNEIFDCCARKLQQQKTVGKYSLKKLILLNFMNFSKIFKIVGYI